MPQLSDAAFAQKRLQLGGVQREPLKVFVRVEVDDIQTRAQHQGPIRIAAAMQPRQGAFLVDRFHRAVDGRDHVLRAAR